MIDQEGVLIDPDVRRHLGEAGIADIVARIEPSGDCTHCHDTLTDGQLTLTVHAAATDSLLVLPAHAACRPSALVTHPAGRLPTAPPTEYHTTPLILPVLETRHKKQRGRSTRTNPVPALLINPNVDVQRGNVVRGRWRSWWEEAADKIGLAQLTQQGWLPPAALVSWAAELHSRNGTDSIAVEGPAMHFGHDGVEAEWARLVRGRGQCLILLSDLFRTRFPSTEDFVSALNERTVYGAWAALGGKVAPVVASEPEGVDEPVPPVPGARRLKSSDEIAAVLEDVEVDAIACFSEQPVVGLGRMAAAGGGPRGLPVLLLEPRKFLPLERTDSGARRELRVDGTVGRGLDYMTAETTVPAAAARDWHVRRTSDGVELTAPFGEIVARAQPKLPPRWLTEAERVGHVLVVYGPFVGVRAAKARSHAAGRTELERARRAGLVSWGLVQWRPETGTSPAANDRGDALGDRSRARYDLSGRLQERILRMEKFSVNVDRSVSKLIEFDGLAPWLTHLWPIRCQTCGLTLGTKVDVSIDGLHGGNQVLVTMHHASCRPSGTSPLGGVQMKQPTYSIAASWLGDNDGPSSDDIPVVLVNPSCEHLTLAREGTGWRNSTLDEFTHLGFASANGRFPPRATGVRLGISGNGLSLKVAGKGVRHHEWSIPECPEHVRMQIGRASGIAVGIATKALPSRLEHGDIPAFLGDQDVMVGWVPINRR